LKIDFGAIYGRQPKASILDTEQRRIAQADPAFREALRRRVRNPERFAAFMAGKPFYTAPERPCARCGGHRKRARDHTCYDCILERNRSDWEMMQAGIRPPAKRSLDGHRDLLARQKRERAGESISRTWATADPPGTLTVTRHPTGRTECHFPDAHHEPDLAKLDGRHVHRLCVVLPELREALEWAGWW